MSEFIPLRFRISAREAELAGQAITSGWVSTSGGKVTEFEEALAAYVGMPRAVACNAGTSALHLAAMAAGITRGDEVIVPTLTFIAAVNPLTRYVGAEPIFIGCDDSLCIDPTPSRISVRTTASCGTAGCTTKPPAHTSRHWRSCMCSATWPTCPA